MITLTNRQARQLLLLKHGLIGDFRFIGKEGAFDFVKQAGCIQFDPVDVCGKNAELVLQSRVKNFTKQTLESLLYQDRVLIDYFDKNLSIFPIGDWPYFARFRDYFKSHGRSVTEINSVRESVKQMIRERGPVCSADLELPQKVNWYWSDTKLSRAALEQLYYSGELAVHHKKGSIKYYDLAENCIPTHILTAPDPFPDELEHHKWRILRRIGAVGMLWNRPSDAWLNIWNLKADERNRAFGALLAEGKLLELTVEGIKTSLYCRSQDLPIIDIILLNPELKPRCEFLAPLDSMLWDRKLIKALFDYDYTWEIYTPPEKRKYGHYVLPVLYGDRLIGRIDTACDRKNKHLTVNNFWYEPGVKKSKALTKILNTRLARFAAFHVMTDSDFLNK